MGFARAADNFLNTYVFGWSLRLVRQNFGTLSRAVWIITWAIILLLVAWIAFAILKQCWCLNDCCTGIIFNVFMLLVLAAVLAYMTGPMTILHLILPWITMDTEVE